MENYSREFIQTDIENKAKFIWLQKTLKIRNQPKMLKFLLDFYEKHKDSDKSK